MDPQGEIRALPPMGLSQGPRLPNVYVEPEEEYYMYGSDFDAVSETGSGAMYYSNPHYSVYSNGMPAQTYPPLPPSTVGGPGSSSRGGGGGYGSSERQAQGTQASPGMLYELDDYYAPSVVSSSNDRSGRSRTPQLQQPYTSGPAIPSTAAYLNNNGPSQSLNLYYTPQQQQGPQGYAPYAGGSNVRLAAESGQLYTNSDGSNGNRRLSPKYDATSGLYKSNM